MSNANYPPGCFDQDINAAGGSVFAECGNCGAKDYAEDLKECPICHARICEDCYREDGYCAQCGTDLESEAVK